MPRMTNHDDQNLQEGLNSLGNEKMSRRDFLRRGSILATGMGALMAAMSPLRQLQGAFDPEEFVQKHYKEMTPEEMDKVIYNLKLR